MDRKNFIYKQKLAKHDKKNNKIPFQFIKHIIVLSEDPEQFSSGHFFAI
jgi:hypothetical protein